MSEKPEHSWFLVSRYLSGEATPEEAEQLQEDLQRDPALQQQIDLLSQLWQLHQKDAQEESSPDKISRILQLSALDKVIETTEEAEQSEAPAKLIPFRKKLLRYVAVVLGLLGISALFLFYKTSNNEGNDGLLIAKNGSRTRAILPDGSTVWLNAGSTISYSPGFNEKLREVTLQGEAYFDVIKQPDRPFIVHAGSIDIRVLGTAFNVKSYPDDKTVETTLIRGLVQIDRKDQQQPIYLKPHQKIVLPVSNEPVTPSPHETASTLVVKKQLAAIAAGISVLDSSLKDEELVETAWIFNRLEFRGDNFIELARKLERWYNIDIHFMDERSKQLQFNGSLENETVEQAMSALQIAVPFEFSIKGNEIFIGSQKETLP